MAMENPPFTRKRWRILHGYVSLLEGIIPWLGMDDFLHEERHVRKEGIVVFRPWTWLKNVVFQDRSWWFVTHHCGQRWVMSGGFRWLDWMMGRRSGRVMTMDDDDDDDGGIRRIRDDGDFASKSFSSCFSVGEIMWNSPVCSGMNWWLCWHWVGSPDVP